MDVLEEPLETVEDVGVTVVIVDEVEVERQEQALEIRDAGYWET